MVGRRVWSDRQVIEASQQFVTAADEVWRLQNEDEPECVFFRENVLGDRAPTRGTLQGTYIFAASGKLLARKNSSNPAAILDTLNKGLEAWKALDESERKLDDVKRVEAGFRWEDLHPEKGLVLRRTGRDLPASAIPTSEQADRFNHDAIWFSEKEVRQLLPDKLTGGHEHTIPEALVKRLSCLALVDNVRGQSIPYHPSEDRGSEIRVTVAATSGDQVQLVLRGHTNAVSDGVWKFDPPTYWMPPEKARWEHSIETKIFGHAVYDTSTHEFREFRLLALGARKGRTINNGRLTQGPTGVGFYCTLAPENWRVAPTFINVYGSGWEAPE